MTASQHEVTQLLADWSRGDRRALDKLVPLVHEELRRLAHHYMSRERPGHTLQTTALVNEAYLRLVSQRQVSFQDRAHFFAVSAQVMRHILIDYARKHSRVRRGEGSQHVTLDEAALLSPDRGAEILAIDEALREFETVDPRASRVVELRYFGGMTIEETAAVLKVSPMTVRRDWRSAKAWLFKAVTSDKQE